MQLLLWSDHELQDRFWVACIVDKLKKNFTQYEYKTGDEVPDRSWGSSVLPLPYSVSKDSKYFKSVFY